MTWLILGMAVSLGCAEIVARMLPVNMGLYRTENSAMWPLYGYGSQQHYAYSITWQMLFPNSGETNNYGQIASHDYVPGAKPVAVIGDSFIESQMNPYEQTVQGRLNEQFGGNIPVYGFGFGGNSLAEYLALAGMTRIEFVPTALVVVIIDNDVKESWQHRIGHRYFRIGESGISEEYSPLDRGSIAKRVRKVIGDSALYRYIQVNLGFTPNVVYRKHAAPKSTAPTEMQDDAAEAKSRLAVDYFLLHMAEAAGLTANRVILVFDSDRERIYDPTRPPRKGVDSLVVQTYLKEKASALGYTVIDTGPLFAQHYAEHHRRFDFTPTDRHWNTLGHGVVAAIVFAKLKTTLCEIDQRLGPRICDPTTVDAKSNGSEGF